MRSHRPNWKMTDVVSAVRFYDDKVQFAEDLEATATSFGITEEIMKKLAEHHVSLALSFSRDGSSFLRHRYIQATSHGAAATQRQNRGWKARASNCKGRFAVR